ncbi:MAG: hypothetical protein H0W85_04830 [Methylotenera sp.]|nr:hypothetical protein [Methylotenera sp.]
MKRSTWVGCFFMSVLLSNHVLADETPSSEIPTVEKDFVNVIHKFDKSKIIAQFGEPATADDVKIKDSDKVVASIWHYHFINTTADGTYYETTELDFIDDKVVMVVFLNNDGSEGNNGGNKYEMPGVKPEL